MRGVFSSVGALILTVCTELIKNQPMFPITNDERDTAPQK